MKKLKHSKFKNTGLIFNLLSNQLTSDILSNKVNESLKILKKYFKEGTELHKELLCYQAILNTNTTKESIAQKLIELTVQQHNKLNKKKLNFERYNLVKEIHNHYPESFFNSNVNNYKVLASTYKLFEHDLESNIIDYNNNYIKLMELITESKVIENTNTDLNELDNLPKDIQQIAYNSLVKKFNEKYKSLNEGQKRLINKFVTENVQSIEFKDFIISEAIEVKQNLQISLVKVNDNVLKIKLNEIMNLIDNIIHTKQIKENQLSALIKYYELIDIIK